jgi:hypothetical protein
LLRKLPLGLPARQVGAEVERGDFPVDGIEAVDAVGNRVARHLGRQLGEQQAAFD